MAGVFINYRGDDSLTAAPLIDGVLAGRFGRDSVFLDSRSIPPGADFVEELLGRLRDCDVLLVVIGPRWLTVADEAGRRRLDDPADWVRREIVEAFALGMRVIPVLLDGVEVPAEADLPRELAALSRRQYVALRRRHTEEDLNRLVDEITAREDARATQIFEQSWTGDEDPEDFSKFEESIGWLLLLFGLGAMLFGIFLYENAGKDMFSGDPWRDAFLLGLGSVSMLSVEFDKRSSRRALRKRARFARSRTLRVDGEGVTVTDPSGTQQIPWARIALIRVDHVDCTETAFGKHQVLAFELMVRKPESEATPAVLYRPAGWPLNAAIPNVCRNAPEHDWVPVCVLGPMPGPRRLDLKNVIAAVASSSKFFPHGSRDW